MDDDTRVSIHAPVKGRPEPLAMPLWDMAVSIHAPVKGRPVYIDGNPEAGIVSIHAPVKGRLFALNGYRLKDKSFNPRPREGATIPMRPGIRFHRFQSTPP